MRRLNKRQKNILKEASIEGAVSVDNLTEEEYWYIYHLNPHEDFDGNVNRYLNDLFWERKFKNENH